MLARGFDKAAIAADARGLRRKMARNGDLARHIRRARPADQMDVAAVAGG